MKNWVLRVELDGEWEECGFSTRKEALATFVALAKDYSGNLQSAILVPGSEREATARKVATQRKWVN